MFKKIIATSAATCLALQIGFGAGTASANDIQGHWAQAKMQHLIDQRVLTGLAADVYAPNNNVTRAEMATFLVRALKLSNVNNTKTFSDVQKGAWYADPIAIASSYGLVSGYDDGLFRPNQQITRAEMASMMVGGLKLAGMDVSKTAALNFKDTWSIGDWAKPAIGTVYAYEIMSGQTGFVFAPNNLATRAEAAAVIYNLLHVDPQAPERPKLGESGVSTLYTHFDYGTALAAQANAKPKVDGGGVFVASKDLVNYYMNPNSFPENTPEYYQFLKLNTPIIGLNIDNVNRKILSGMGILDNQAYAFVIAGQQYQINELYLISHALHETGKGSSQLARGVEVGIDPATGKATMVTPENRWMLTDIMMTYNMYGIGAVDAGPLKFGSERAYEMGWFTVEAAIVGGSKFIRERYIDIGKDTLYKMRWNVERPGTYQYATHVQWATIAARNMQKMYEQTGAATTAVRHFEVPQYINQPWASALPTSEAQYALDWALSGQVGTVLNTNSVAVRSYPSTRATNYGELALGTNATIVGTNGGWYYVNYGAYGESYGWVHGGYFAPLSWLAKADVEPAAERSVMSVEETAGVQHADDTPEVDTSWVDGDS